MTITEIRDWDLPTPPPEASGFAAVPTWMIRGEPDLSAHGLLVYLVLSSYVDTRGEAWPSVSTIARYARIGRTTAKKALGELEQLGIIERDARRREDGAQTSNVYRVNIGMRAGQEAYMKRGRVTTKPRSRRDSGSVTTRPRTISRGTRSTEVEGGAAEARRSARAPSGVSRHDRGEVSDLPATRKQIAYASAIIADIGGSSIPPDDLAEMSRAEISALIQEWQPAISDGFRREAGT